MAFSDFQAKQKQNALLAVVRDYFSKHDGHLLCLSDDASLVSLLRAIVKDLSLPQAGLLSVIPGASKALKCITESYEEGKKPAVFIERMLNDIGDTGFLIRQFKDSFPELKILVMTTTAEKSRVMLLHEAGADSFILKPISRNDMVEKMAAVLRPPGALRQLLDKARKFIIRNVSAEAMLISKKVLELKPDNAAGYVVLGDALRLSGDVHKARAAYERAHKYSPEFFEPLQKLVDLARETGDKERQLEYLKCLDALSPLNAQRKVEIGELHIALGNTEAATQVFDNAVSRVFKEAMAQVAAMTEKVAVSIQDSDPVQAEKYLRKCLELKGKDLSADDIAIFNHLGISLRKQGRWQDAITEYQKALKISPREAGLYYNIGMAHAEGRDYESAVRNMQKALSINPALPESSARLAYNMGKIFALGYTRDKAFQCLETALALEPGFEAAQKELELLKQQEQQSGESGAL
ncbi:tetratricopeptide repeat protein [Desulfovibrio sp. OttesenSCG-928-A18]|nr:tetratricopeptide repeat protein [Desulfovibrio sp. OttesenSCG-928-A18]